MTLGNKPLRDLLLTQIYVAIYCNYAKKVEIAYEIRSKYTAQGVTALNNGNFSEQLYITMVSLTYWGRDKMAAIFQTTLLKSFSWMKMYKFRLRFHWSLFPMVQLTIFQHWFR